MYSSSGDTDCHFFFHGEVEGVTYLVILVKISAKLGGKCHVLWILIDDILDSKWNKAVSKSSSYYLNGSLAKLILKGTISVSHGWMCDGMIVDLEMAKYLGHLAVHLS